ncbi:hypothetical protein GCK32_015939 [Trichostrongylus colubriformis]|uniref:Uncharacterized protein n=1 Tax=Trichostrongylus colubriformis TaxID=6319 RepID=A0AAN8IPR4_TRICO
MIDTPGWDRLGPTMQWRFGTKTTRWLLRSLLKPARTTHDNHMKTHTIAEERSPWVVCQDTCNESLHYADLAVF